MLIAFSCPYVFFSEGCVRYFSADACILTIGRAFEIEWKWKPELSEAFGSTGFLLCVHGSAALVGVVGSGCLHDSCVMLCILPRAMSMPDAGVSHRCKQATSDYPVLGYLLPGEVLLLGTWCVPRRARDRTLGVAPFFVGERGGMDKHLGLRRRSRAVGQV